LTTLNTTLNNFITESYDKIRKMAGNICKSKDSKDDLCHYAIEKFMLHERAVELVEKKQAMLFLSGIMWRSWHSTTSPYHKLYRQSGRVHELYDSTYDRLCKEWADDEYDIETDLKIESIQGIIEDMKSDTTEQWFRVTLFEMWLKESNYSELSRITKIPRTSISQAVNECKDYIKNRIELWS